MRNYDLVRDVLIRAARAEGSLAVHEVHSPTNFLLPSLVRSAFSSGSLNGNTATQFVMNMGISRSTI